MTSKAIKAMQAANIKHGMSRTKIYHLWQKILDRCRCVTDRRYPKYGGRGITVCDRWLKFENFFADMGHRPDGMSIERIDNNSGYSPENCKWATAFEQDRNKRSNVIITCFGKSQCQKDWCVEYGINHSTLRNRLNRSKWSIEKALTTPIAHKRKK